MLLIEVIDGTKVFVTAGRGFGGALFDVTGATTPVWEQQGLSSHWHTSVLVDGYVFGSDGNHSEGAGRSRTSLRRLDWKTGEIKWTEPKLGFNGLIAIGRKPLADRDGGSGLADARSDGYTKLGSAHVIAGRAFAAPAFANERCSCATSRVMLCVSTSGAK
jgi:outer membrane protein assembly factor BamB